MNLFSSPEAGIFKRLFGSSSHTPTDGGEEEVHSVDDEEGFQTDQKSTAGSDGSPPADLAPEKVSVGESRLTQGVRENDAYILTGVTVCNQQEEGGGEFVVSDATEIAGASTSSGTGDEYARKQADANNVDLDSCAVDAKVQGNDARTRSLQDAVVTETKESCGGTGEARRTSRGTNRHFQAAIRKQLTHTN